MKAIFKNPLFLGGVVIKLLISFSFTSRFTSALFLPFINYGVENGLVEAYQHFCEAGGCNAFPYPPLMYYLTSLPFQFLALFKVAGNLPEPLGLFLLKLVLLIFDFLILLVLLKWLRGREKKALILYWLSPLILYVNYLHGQLDIIPIGFLFFSLYYLFRNNPVSAAFFLALAICCKTHILVVLPIFLFYVVKTNVLTRRNGLQATAVFLAPLMIFFLPLLEEEGFFQMVLANKEQAKSFIAYYDFGGGLKFVFVIAAYLFLVMRLISFKWIGKDLILVFTAFVFGIFLFFIPPMPGWYIWVVPLFIYFLIKQDYSALVPFVLLNVFYLFYFPLNPLNDFKETFLAGSVGLLQLSRMSVLSEMVGEEMYSNVVFTLLQTSIMLFCFWIYQRGIISILKNKLYYQPYLIGIGGDSGAGKSTLTELVVSIFSKSNTTIVCGDDMHRWERGDAKWDDFTHLDPRANHLHGDMMQLNDLRRGVAIYRRTYDHQHGKFTKPVKVKANKIIISEGLHPFFLNYQANLYDLKIFLKPNEELRKIWKIERDFTKRGHQKEKVLEQITRREKDANQYIYRQEKMADIVVSTQPVRQVDANQHLPDEHIETFLQIKCRNEMYLEEILGLVMMHSAVVVEHHYEDEHQIIQFKGDISKEEVEQVAEHFTEALEDLSIFNSDWEGGHWGIVQLVTCHAILTKKEVYV